MAGDGRMEGVLAAVLTSSAGRIWVDAGRLNVDFAMTGPWPGAGPAAARWEGMSRPDDLADWLTACPLRLPALRVTAPDLRDALRLRDAVWGLTRAAVESRERPRRATTTVNKYAAGPPVVPQLTARGRSWLGPTTAQVLATIARDAVELHSDAAQLVRLRECASDDCPRSFYDTSRPGTRRWCDPVRCGDRQRARRYRSEHRRLAERAGATGPARTGRGAGAGGRLEQAARSDVQVDPPITGD